MKSQTKGLRGEFSAAFRGASRGGRPDGGGSPLQKVMRVAVRIDASGVALLR